MKLSLEWLSEFVAWKEKDVDAIARRLTLSVAEIEGVEAKGELLGNCCVGKVLSIARHPNADRLSLVDVETDRGIKKCVCGGSNVKEGMLVAFAHIGATVKWHGGELMTLEPVKIRGEASEGMICAAEELGLQEDFKPSPSDGEHPIMDLTSLKLKTGATLKEALVLDDAIFDISNTAITHRPDLFSHVGFARECVAVGLGTWKKGQPHEAKPKFAAAALPFKASQKEKTLVPGYAACTLEVSAHGITPEWMKRRLEALGIRSINLPIDITNYTMLETGVPLHAFDLSAIHGKEILFRESVRGEKVTTLDGVTRTLPDGLIVLADDKGIFDLCGIMGDDRSATRDGTRHFFLHAPSFDPKRLRQAIQKLQHRTDAATIFEKGVPPAMCELALLRAAELFLAHCPGATVTSKLISWNTAPDPKPITLPFSLIEGALGMPVSPKKMQEILENLGCSVKKSKAALVVTPAMHRVRDLKIEEDLVEEIGRMIGYENVPDEMPASAIRIPERDNRLHLVRDALAADGYLELVPLSITGPALLERAGLDPKEALRLQNPIGDEFSLLMPSTLPALLAHAEGNLRRVAGELKTFHWGKMFHEDGEYMEFGAMVAAAKETPLLSDPFLTLKENLEHAFMAAGYELGIEIAKDHAPYAHPGRHALLVSGGRQIGEIFEVHPQVRQRFDLPARASVARVHLSILFESSPKEKLAKSIPRFPDVSYDVTATRSHAAPLGRLIEKLRAADPLLTAVSVVDLYAGKQTPAGQYNVTLRCTYSSPERTLTEEEAKKAHEKVEQLVKEGA